jgi:flavodoxin
MTRSRVLVVYFSRSGHTKQVAERVARALGADLEAIRDHADRGGWLGYLRCGFETALGASSEIDPPRHDPSRYDLVVVGTPVWGASVSTPVRTWLWHERARLPDLAFFCTLGGMGAGRALGQMERVAGKPPLATLAVREAEVAASRERVEAFAAEVRDAPRRRRRGRARAA